MQVAFLCNNCILNVPFETNVFVLHTDASKLSIGCVLNVIWSASVLPVAFYSRQLRDSESRYSAAELEGLAIHDSIMHFSYYLYGTSFEVITDYKALTSMMCFKVLTEDCKGGL